MQNRYAKLLGNTLIFALGSFSSKAMVFLLMPLYTRALTTAQFGVTDLITTTSNLLAPFVMLSINEAMIRFGMDRSLKKAEVLSIGLFTVMCGFTVFCLFSLFMLKIQMISQYTLLIYLYVLLATLKSIVAQFVRAIGLVRLYAFDGFLATLTVILFNLLFLLVFHWGVVGYILSIILSNLVSVCFLFLVARLSRYINLWPINIPLLKSMLRYSIPLIPTTLFWWITNVSDRYLITYFKGASSTGLYSVAYKLTGLMTIISVIFYQAWQISAVSEAGQGENTKTFYSNVFEYFTTLLVLAASGIIMLARPIFRIWVSDAFYIAWRFVPFLVISEVFSSLVTFMGSFYMVSKRNATIPISICVGAVSNILLNLWLIPRYDAQGAAFATAVSYILAYVVRAVDVRRLVPLRLRPWSTVLSLVLLSVQSAFLLIETTDYLLTQLIMFLLVVLCNIFPVMRLFFAVLDKIQKKGIIRAE